ncbi:MAG: heparinase II/III domain-containing protein, partial [Thermomicrobiales bacterium]
SPCRYVNFSDCDQNITEIPAQHHNQAQPLAHPPQTTLAGDQPGPGRSDFAWRLRDLFWRSSSAPAGRFVPARHDWFSGMHWMIARADPGDPAALTLAAKGGHNGEMHNQNDVGAIIVQVNGESVIADPGRGRYTRAYLGPERYDQIVNASAGHSVPVTNGQEQLTGKAHGAAVLEHRADDEADVLALELRGAYGPAADLQSLRRVVTLHREARPWVELVDSARFASGPGQLTSVLITFGIVESAADELILRGERGTLRVGFDAALVAPQVEEVRDVDLASGTATIRRVLFTWRQPAREGEIRLRIEPA